MFTNTRSSLSPYFHPKRRLWYARGTYPVKEASGQIVRKRGFCGSGSDTRAACQAICDRLNREFEAAVVAPEQAATFDEAVLTYLQLGGDGRFLTDALLDELGSLRCDAIDDGAMGRAAKKLYPEAAVATLNRQLYTPVIAVVRLASKGKDWRRPDLTRPKGYNKLKPAKSPPTPWFAKVLPHCDPDLLALLLFTTLHARRVGEAIQCLPDHYDPVAKTVTIDRTKAGNSLVIPLAKPVWQAIEAYDWKACPGLFGSLTLKNRRSVFRRLATACKRAGAPYFTPHKAGRHAFAKRLLDGGFSLAHLKGAGDWSTIRVVAELYGHMEHSEVAADTQRIGEAWAEGVVPPFKVADANSAANG